ERLFLAVLERIILDKDSGEEIISCLDAGINWEHFWLLVLYHRVENLIYLGLKDYFAFLPAEAVLRLKGYWLQSQGINQKNLISLKEVLLDFYNLGIKVIPLKGLILSQGLYGDINCRGIPADFDCLVDASSRFATEDKLRGQGYEVKKDIEPEGLQWQKDAIRIKDGVDVDLHWNLSRSWKDQAVLDRMWADARQQNLAGINYLSLSLEDLLIYLSVHLADGDGFVQLIHVCDIARFIHIFQDKIDFSELLDKARRYNLTNSLYYGLLLAKGIISAPVRGDVLLKLKPGLLKRMAIAPFVRRQNFFAETFTRKFVGKYFSFFLFDFIEAKRIKDYLRLLRFMLFGPGKEDEFSPVSFIKRLFRPFNWLIRQFIKPKTNFKATRIY
ncbi:MAG: nucleotidyltransferase family protein, partial [Candidatus Subteraquimicrobiales bacterium]|nr:nucleotidyltransferase family protein [Candidatus Subteraquimicrobiales bacterium]